jgi:hypothetical protein
MVSKGNGEFVSKPSTNFRFTSFHDRLHHFTLTMSFERMTQFCTTEAAVLKCHPVERSLLRRLWDDKTQWVGED